MRNIQSFAVLCVLLLSTSSTPVAAQKPITVPSPRVIGTPDGYVMSFPTAINDRGHVAGDTSTSSGPQEPFFWSEDDGFVLFTDGISGNAADMNDKSVVVGGYFPAGPLWSSHGFLWSPKDGLTDLGDFHPRAINNRGDMAGNCAAAVNAPCIRYASGKVLYLTANDPSVQLWPVEINDYGAVLGAFQHGTATGDFFWSPSTGVVLNPSAPTHRKQVVLMPWVNRHGVVVGQIISESGYSAHAWRPTDGSALNLHDPGIGPESYAFAVNDKNQVVGVFMINGWMVGAIWKLPNQWVHSRSH